MNIFEFNNYKKFVNKRILEMPKRGHGQYRKMSIYLAVSSVNVSQIFKGDRELTVEQACSLCEFFGLAELESQYFVNLVEFERAGTHQLKTMIKKRLGEIHDKAQDLKHRLVQQKQLNEETRAIFYSNWYFSGIRLATSIPHLQTVDSISERFDLPLTTVNRVLLFLMQHGLCIEEKGKFRMGPSSTHLEASSPLVSRHHLNWRMKGIEKMEHFSSEELFLTLPCSLNLPAMKAIRKELVDVIERVTKIVDDAPSERVACFNIDFFNLK